MTHLRLWRFDVPEGQVDRFAAAYRADGDWAKLFETAPGFMRTDLWRAADGSYLTADLWRSAEDFERFQASQGEEYRRLDKELEGVAGTETFIGAFDLID